MDDVEYPFGTVIKHPPIPLNPPLKWPAISGWISVHFYRKTREIWHQKSPLFQARFTTKPGTFFRLDPEVFSGDISNLPELFPHLFRNFFRHLFQALIRGLFYGMGQIIKQIRKQGQIIIMQQWCQIILDLMRNVCFIMCFIMCLISWLRLIFNVLQSCMVQIICKIWCSCRICFMMGQIISKGIFKFIRCLQSCMGQIISWCISLILTCNRLMALLDMKTWCILLSVSFGFIYMQCFRSCFTIM